MEPYWFENPTDTILNPLLLDEFLPERNMGYPRKVNSLVRLSIYLGLLLCVLDYRFLFLPVSIMIITYVLYLFRKQGMQGAVKKVGPNATLADLPQATKEKFSNYLDVTSGVIPTLNNPFMNAMPYDSRNRAPAPYVNTKPLQNAVEANYNRYLMKDSSDVFNHTNGRRQFYTMPSTTYPNNQTEFALWLYGTPPTCKEGNGAQCVANNYTGLGLYGNTEINYNV
jgi:hypothetical protein